MATVEQRDPRVGGKRRMVYVDVDKELDGDDEGLEIGLWLPKNGRIPMVCTSNCNAITDTTLSPSISTKLCAKREDGSILAGPICNVDAVNDFARKWPPPEPYSKSLVVLDSGRFNRRRLERHNYAKALLRSEKELENLSKKIRAELQQSEMMELALEAERAASAGITSFSATPTLFGPAAQGPSLISRPKSRRSRTFSEGDKGLTSSVGYDRRVQKLRLRDVAEVIPKWRELHLHMRTHLYRRKVSESSLIFKETNKDSKALETSHNEHVANKDAKDSFKFWGRFAGRTMQSCISHAHKRAVCDKIEEIDNESHFTDDSSTDVQIGTILSSHIVSPGKKTPFWQAPTPSFPSVMNNEDNELGDSDVTPSKVQPANKVPFTYTGTSRPQDDVAAVNKDAVRNNKVALMTSTLDSNDHPNLARHSECPAGSIDAEMAKGSEVLNVSPKPDRSPMLSDGNSNGLDESARTPLRPTADQASSGFATPAGLRDIRRSRENILKTPDTERNCFEPSSIVDAADFENARDPSPSMVSLHSEDANFLALPSINVPLSSNEAEKWSIKKLSARRGTRQPWPLEESYQMFDGQKDEHQFSRGLALTGPGEREQLPVRNIHVKKSVGWEASDFSTWAEGHDETKNPMDAIISARIEQGPNDQPSSICTKLFHEGTETTKMTSLCLDPQHKGPQALHQYRNERPEPIDSHLDSTFPSDYVKHARDVSLFGKSSDKDEEEKKDSEPSAPCRVAKQSSLQKEGQGSELKEIKNIDDKRCKVKETKRSPHGPRDAISFDVESYDDDSSGSVSIHYGYDEHTLFPSATWGGHLVLDDHSTIRRISSWPGPGREVELATTMESSARAAVPWPKIVEGSTLEGDSSQQTHSQQVNVMCSNFPSTDETFHIAIEMIAGLSPKKAKPHVSEAENREFLKNYFYCSKNDTSCKRSKSKDQTEAVYVDACQLDQDGLCHSFGVDAVCRGIRSLLATSNPKPNALRMSSRHISVSLDDHQENRETSTDWFAPVETLFNQCGSTRNPSDGVSDGPIQFEPPFLRKATAYV